MPQAKKNKSKGPRRGSARSAGPTRSTGSAPARSASTTPAQAIPPGLTSAKKANQTIPPGLTSAKQAPPGPLPGANGASGLLLGTVDHTALVPSVARAPAPDDAQSEAQAAEGPDDLPQWAANATEELLTVSYWLDPGETGDPFSATIRFTGRRSDVTGKPQPRDSFSVEQTVNGIIPGSGPVAVTVEVRGINAGQWSVTARPAPRTGTRPYRPYPPGEDAAASSRVPWPRRVTIPAEPAVSVHTATLLRTKVPGVIRFAYASLVCSGVLVGLGLEALLLSHGHYSLLLPMVFSAIAIVAGVIGGKGWYVAVHRGRKYDGWCIQGFVAGAAVVVAAAALAGLGIPAGAFLAAAAPALLIGMSIGRPGCFWAGCCTGRPTAARWGIWSSDRKLGCRRAPAQLLEALAALVSGVTVLAVVLTAGLARSGPAAVVGLACYTLGRQFILGLRAEPRVWPAGRVVTGAIAALALIAGVVLLVRR
jgi:phosphatidylglycerol:prolipoprotein diacylglycerol transferase